MDDSMHFLCRLYQDALGIHSVALIPKSSMDGFLIAPNQYTGPLFELVLFLSLTYDFMFVYLFIYIYCNVGYLTVFVSFV